jgi:hypothetical protein
VQSTAPYHRLFRVRGFGIGGCKATAVKQASSASFGWRKYLPIAGHVASFQPRLIQQCNFKRTFLRSQRNFSLLDDDMNPFSGRRPRIICFSNMSFDEITTRTRARLINDLFTIPDRSWPGRLRRRRGGDHAENVFAREPGAGASETQLCKLKRQALWRETATRQGFPGLELSLPSIALEAKLRSQSCQGSRSSPVSRIRCW